MCLLLGLLLSASHRHDGRQNVRWRERIRRPVCRHIEQLGCECDYMANAGVGFEVTLAVGEQPEVSRGVQLGSLTVVLERV